MEKIMEIMKKITIIVKMEMPKLLIMMIIMIEMIIKVKV